MLQTIDAELVMQWLDRSKVPHYICGDCHGLHLSELQALEGVLESRLFVESDSLMFFTELEIRPSMVLPVLAQVSRFNLTYMHLKVFVDLIDESLPRLVIQDTQPFAAGLNFEQFHLFLDNCVQATLHLTEECQRESFLTSSSQDSQGPSSRSAMH